MDDADTPTKRPPAFGRRSKPASTSNSRQSTPRSPHPAQHDPSAAYPDKTDSARGSLTGSGAAGWAGKGGGKFESILSLIAAKEADVDGVADDGASDARPASGTRSASPSLIATTRPPSTISSYVSFPASSDAPSTAQHQRSMSATVSYSRPPPSTQPFSATTSQPHTPNASASPPLPASAATPSTTSPFDAYKHKVHSLTQAVASLQTTLHSAQHDHSQQLVAQQAGHQQALSALQRQFETRLAEQLAFIEQLVASKQQLTTDLDAQVAHVKRREEQLLTRHVELELEADSKLKQRLDAAKQDWRDKDMRAVKASIAKAMQAEVDKLRAKQADDVKALDDKWRETVHSRQADMERQWKAREADVRRECAEDGRREKEREERRRDELMRQVTSDLSAKQAELSRQHEQDRRLDRQRWEDDKQADEQRRQSAQTERDERINREWEQRLTALQQSHEADKQRYDSDCQHKLQRAITDAEEQIRAQVRREGEAELAHVIERLGEETVQLSKDERAKHRQAMDKLHRERADERSEWKEKERAWKDKLDRAAEQVAVQRKQLDKDSQGWQVRWSEAEEWKQQLDQLLVDKQTNATIQQHSLQHDNDALTQLQQQFKRSSERWQREKQQLHDEQQEERAGWQVRWEEKREKEMREVERRVKETVRKKDEVIDGLQKEMRRLQGLIVQMTDTIEQQKHELLSLG